MNGQHPPFRNHDIILLDTVNLQQINLFIRHHLQYTRTQRQRKEQEQEQQK